MRKIEIRHRYTDDVLFSAEVDDNDWYPMRSALEKAILVGANLDGANLVGANLVGANLVGANLVGANLVHANLVGANLVGANLVHANLVGANLDGANLVHANLVGANLDPIRDDLYEILNRAPAEVPGLLAALREGRVDGSTYTGECACLVGTIANVRGVSTKDLAAIGIPEQSSRPAERWFLAIKRGDTPASSVVAQVTEEWIEQWMAKRAASPEMVAP